MILFCAQVIYTQPVCHGPEEFDNRKMAPWVDITDYITDAHRAQGYIELTVQVEVDPPYVPGTGDSGDSFYFAKDDDRYGDYDIRAVCDGVRYEMIVEDLKKGNYSSYPIQPDGGQNQDGIWAPLNNQITLRFEVPYQVLGYYKIFIGNNFRSWRRGGSTYQGKILYEEPSPGPYAHAEFPETVVKGVSIEFDGSLSLVYKSDTTITQYEWDFGDGSTAVGEKVTHSYSEAGTYTVTLTVTDSDGNINTYSDTIQVVDAAPSFSLRGLFPNPADFRILNSARIGLNIEEEGTYNISIYSFTGKKITSWSQSLKPGYWEVEWNGTDSKGNEVPGGIYMLVVEGKGKKEVKKFYLVR